MDDIAAFFAREETRFWLSWAALGLGLILSVTLAITQLGIIRRFDEAALLKQQRGRRGLKPATIRRHIDEFERYASSTVRIVIVRTVFVLFFGVVIPGALLGVLVAEQDWLMPGQSMLLDPPDSRELPLDLVAFITDQALRGGLTDAFEVFDITLSPIRNNPDHVIFSWLIIGYRLIAGLIFAVIPFLIYQIIKGNGALAGAIRQLRHQLAEAEGVTA
tara:strand:+ start:52685 stop:53338 length:654 start_codon:yes stop_codon:yes gene_type:complete